MFPMTPLQSWSTIILVMALVVLLFWLARQGLDHLAARLEHDSADESGLDQGSARSAPDLYDWAIHGL